MMLEGRRLWIHTEKETLCSVHLALLTIKVIDVKAIRNFRMNIF
jgi:hypothetical protein